MSASQIVIVGAKVVAVSIILAISFIIGGGLSGMNRMGTSIRQTSREAAPAPAAQTLPGPNWTPPASAQSPQPLDPAKAVRTLFFACLLQGIVLSYLILQAHWTGWKLVGAIFVAVYGVTFFQAGLESWAYLSRMLPSGMVQGMFLMGLIAAALFSPLAVLILGKMKRLAPGAPPHSRLHVSPARWLGEALLVIVAFVAVYYLAGYYIAWRNPAVRAFYGGPQTDGFFEQMALIASQIPWMIPFQAFRGLLYLLCCLPVIRMLKGRPWENGLGVALLMSIVGGAQLLIPNPIFPDDVRMTHFIEVTSSMFVFGYFMGWFLSRAPEAAPRASMEQSVRPAA